MKTYIIVGAGIGGLMAAFKIKDEDPDSDITFIERSIHPGGLLAGIEYQNGLYFDIGTHIFQETGDKNIDFLIQEAINSDDLITFDEGKGDVSGTYFNGRLQNNSHFPDLRYHQEFEILSKSLNNHLFNLSNIPHIDALEPLIKVSSSRFGSVVTEKIINEIHSRIFKTPAENLAGFSLLLTGVSRVIINNEQQWMESSSSEQFRAILGFPDQLQLPPKYRHSRRSYYSKRKGTRNFIDGLVLALKQKGVKFLFGTEIEKFDIKKLVFTVSTKSLKSKIFANRVIFANGVIGAAKVCGIDIPYSNLDKPLSHSIINLQMAQSIDNPLCYFYGMSEGVDFYRVTNYSAFSGNFKDQRVSIEILGKAVNEINIDLIINQLICMGFLSSKIVDFADVVHLPMGFPLPTTKNMQGLNLLSNHLKSKLPETIVVCGVGSKPGLFFQNDIMMDVFNNLNLLL